MRMECAKCISLMIVYLPRHFCTTERNSCSAFDNEHVFRLQINHYWSQCSQLTAKNCQSKITCIVRCNGKPGFITEQW